MLETMPISRAEAIAFIEKHHRHHLPPQGYKFAIGAHNGESVVGVITVGRPVSRNLDNGWTAEVTRCCSDGTRNTCSFLYGAAWRASKAMGYKRLITYILEEEKGTSLYASNFRLVGQAGGGSWHRSTRPRIDTAPTQLKLLFERT